MSRIKRGTTAHKRRKNLLRHAKGFKWGRKNKYRLAKEALLHAWSHAFIGRKLKKRDFRRDWQVRINAGAHQNGVNYSNFTHRLKKTNIALNRKMLAQVAEKYPHVFKQIIASLKR